MPACVIYIPLPYSPQHCLCVLPEAHALSKHVPGRYMVVLRLGGVYADIDCECLQSFDQLIRPRDTMVVAWENEFSTAEEARRRAYVRKRQVSLRFIWRLHPLSGAWLSICGPLK